LSHDPVRWTQFAAGALLFLRGDVTPAHTEIRRDYAAVDLYESMRLPRSAGPLFTPGFPASEFLRHRVRIGSFDGRATAPPIEDATRRVLSDTGELAWVTTTAQTGLVTVDTERTQSLIGFVSAHPAGLRHLSAEVSNRFCALQLTSLEDTPIADATRLLLVTGARVENTGLRWNMIRTVVEDIGHAPSLIEPVSGRIVLRNLRGAKSVSVSALDGASRPLGDPLRAELTADGWSFPIGTTTTPWYEITVTR
jgi:hypothetical protein